MVFFSQKKQRGHARGIVDAAVVRAAIRVRGAGRCSRGTRSAGPRSMFPDGRGFRGLANGQPRQQPAKDAVADDRSRQAGVQPAHRVPRRCAASASSDASGKPGRRDLNDAFGARHQAVRRAPNRPFKFHHSNSHLAQRSVIGALKPGAGPASTIRPRPVAGKSASPCRDNGASGDQNSFLDAGGNARMCRTSTTTDRPSCPDRSASPHPVLRSWGLAR